MAHKPARRPRDMAAAVIFLALGALAAAPPEVVPLRVPSERVSSWFPAGTELTGMTVDRFDRLLRAARAAGAAAESEAAHTPRLLRARHEAIWEDDALRGRSEFVVGVGVGRDADARLELRPWSPAVERAAPGAPRLLADDRGVVSIALEGAPGPTATLVVDWRLRARPGSRGRRFALALPAAPVSRLSLELPREWVPVGPAGARRNPAPAHGADRLVWAFEGCSGESDLSLIDSDAAREPDGMPRYWGERTTRVEVGEASATWSADWALTSRTQGPAVLRFELAAGLDLLGATGPAVEDFAVEPGPQGGSVVAVRFRELPTATSPSGPQLTFHGLAPVPAEGRWVVPASLPLNAEFLGGTTTILVGPSRVIEAVEELGARRVEPKGPAPTPSSGLAVAFESTVAGPPAAFSFHKPRADATVDVRGRLFVGNAVPRLEARLTWRVQRGRPANLDFELPRSWHADRLGFEGVDEPASWYPEVVAGGGARVHVAAPPGDWAARPLVLQVSATAAVAGGRGPLNLPSIRPEHAAVADEAWAAVVADGFQLVPARSRGLAWVEPPPPGPGEAPPTPPARLALAWRWTAPDGEAVVERTRLDAGTEGEVTQVVALTPTAARVRARVTLTSRDDRPALAFGLNAPVAGFTGWRVRDAGTKQDLPLTPLDATARAAAGLTGAGPAWSLKLTAPGRGPLVLEVEAEAARADNLRVPLVLLATPRLARGVAVVRASRDVWAEWSAPGARALDPEIVAGAGPDDEPGDDRPLGAFEYDPATAPLALHSQALAPAGAEGLIRRARLRSTIDPSGTGRQRLTLEVVPGRAASLKVTLPSGARLAAARRDGTPVAPVQEGPSLLVPLADPAASPAVALTLVLDYQGGAFGQAETGEYRPERPAFSFPCLALDWELDLPSGWAVAGWGRSLVPAQPMPARGRWLERLARLGPSFGARDERPDRFAAAITRDLDARLAPLPAGPFDLGRWLLRWDAGEWPVVVDRTALAAAGWGPRSPVAPPATPGTAPGISARSLAGLGLAALPAGRNLLVTTRAEAEALARLWRETPASLPEWEALFLTTQAWGAGPADRFQTVARWCDTATPPPPGPDGAPADLGEAGTRRAWRFATTGWPATGTGVRLVDLRRQAVWRAGVALGVLLLGFRLRSAAGPRRRASAALLITAMGWLLAARTDEAWSGRAEGLFLGGLGVGLFELGRVARSRRPGRARTVPLSSSLRRSAGAGAAAPLGLAAALAVGFATAGLAGPFPDAPILVLYPFDGPQGPERPPDRVVLRLEDFRRLNALAEPPRPATAARALAASALHKLSPLDADRFTVETELELRVEGEGPADWTFPVGDSLQLTATCDDADAPVSVLPGARTAVVRVNPPRRPDKGPRPALLRLRRVVPLATVQGTALLRLPVNPVPAARVAAPSRWEGRATLFPGARGESAVDRNGRLESLLGPVARLEASWAPAASAPGAASAGTAEASYLWDATPAGDRLRARVRFQGRGETSTVRLALGAGLLVRQADVPGLVDASVETAGGQTVWVARIEPPLPDGAGVAFEFWRPLPGDAAPARREAPRLRILGVERTAETLAFRRPPQWPGRLTAANPADAVGEEAFVRDWGPLPAEPLTLSGALRLAPASSPPADPWVETGPEAPGWLVQPSLTLAITPGRFDLTLEADLTERAGPAHEIAVDFPEGFQVLRVSADGLTDWGRAGPQALRLRFDGPPARDRRARVVGWLATGAPAVASGPQERDLAALRPSWPGQTVGVGSLTLASASRFSLEGAAGLTVVSSEQQGLGPAGGSPNRVTYRVDRAARLGRLLWEPEPPRVNVTVQSRVVINPDGAEWKAVLDYDIYGGPLDALNLRLPTTWARGATVRLVGTPHQQVSEARGPLTYWAIRPEAPAWGNLRVVVRAALPFPPGEALVFPDLGVLGRGAVDTYLTLVNATRDRLPVEGSAGLQPVARVAPSGAPPEPEWPRASVSHYHVLRPGWLLRVKRPAPRPSDGPDADGAEVVCVRKADGTVLGSSRYDLADHPGPFLEFDLDDGASLLWAEIDGKPTTPLALGLKRLLPRDRSGPARLDLVWSLPATAGPRPRLPALARGSAITLLTAYGPGPAGPLAGLTPATPARADLERARRRQREILASLADLDRGSDRDLQRLSAALQKFELDLRGAARAAAVEREPGPTTAEAQRLRAEVEEAVTAASLDPLAAAARQAVGANASDVQAPNRPAALAPGLAVPGVGHPSAFLPARGPAPPVAAPDWGMPATLAVSTEGSAAFPLAALGLATVWLVGRSRAASLWGARAALALALAGLFFGFGPLWAAAAAGLTLAGVLASRP